MSDFDKAVVASMLKAREIGVQRLASDCEAILQAAIASMQGEAVYLVIDHDTLWRQVGKSEYDRAEENNRMITFTHAPDSAARIAELEAENAKLKMAIEYDNADDNAEWEPPHPIFQLAQERDNFMFRVNEQDAEIARLKAEIETLHTTMMAAAVEIQEHWNAHCDDEGYGPANLMHRLESGIAARYGYDAKTVVSMEAEIARLQKELEEAKRKLSNLAVVGFYNFKLHRFFDDVNEAKRHGDYKPVFSAIDAAIRQIGGAE